LKSLSFTQIVLLGIHRKAFVICLYILSLVYVINAEPTADLSAEMMTGGVEYSSLTPEQREYIRTVLSEQITVVYQNDDQKAQVVDFLYRIDQESAMFELEFHTDVSATHKFLISAVDSGALHTIEIEGFENPPIIARARSIANPSSAGYKAIFGNSNWPSTDNFSWEPRCLPYNTVVFVSEEPSSISPEVFNIGNGVRISEHCILTASHVANALEKKESVKLELFPFDELEYKYTYYFESEVLQETDLAIVVATSDSWSFDAWPKLGKSKPERLDEVVIIGCPQLGDQVRVGTGVVTVESRQTQSLNDFNYYEFGTNCMSFPSLSGSPIYDLDSGHLIGIRTRGIKRYSASGPSVEIVTNDKSEWDDYSGWSWEVDITRYRDAILTAVEEIETSLEQGK